MGEFITPGMKVAFLIMGILGVLIIGGYYYFDVTRKKRVGKRKESKRKNPPASFRDICELAPFDDVIGFGPQDIGLIVDEDWTRFAIGLNITGFDFDLSTAEQRYQANRKMIAVTNLFDFPVMIRQESRYYKINGCRQNIMDQLTSLREQYIKVKTQSEEISEEITIASQNRDPDIILMSNLYQQLEELEREEKALSGLILERLDIADVVSNVNESSFRPDRVNQFYIEWTYNKLEYTIHPLTKPEIVLEAKRQLMDKSETIISVLQSGQLKVTRMTKEEIIEAEYLHFHPGEKNDVRIRDMLNSSLFTPFVTSDSVKENRRAAREEQMLIQKLSRAEQNELEVLYRNAEQDYPEERKGGEGE